MTREKFYVTTPIYYANAPAHIGGAYTTIAADVLKRWNQVLGKDTFFLTGTDEHGQKIQEAAEEANEKPQQFVDKIAKQWKELFKKLNISNNFFIRTTNTEHEKEVQNILQKLYEKGYIYKGNYESHYCVGCEQYLSENDLVEGKCPLHNKKPELRKEEAYLFKLSGFQDKLIELIENGEYEILPKRMRKEVLTFLKSGLRDISISRLKEKIRWGIELPFDKNHTCFVWVDAFWNYLTGLSINNKFEEFWPADVQLMARDILRVHATIWPALLMAMGHELPKTLFIHGYFTVRGRKMSKSLGNIIDPLELLKKYPSDSIRYYLMRNIPFGQDGDVSEQVITDRHNNELANKLGNLVSRIAGLAEKKGIEKTENSFLKKLNIEKIKDLFNNYEFDKGLNKIFDFIDDCNEYVQNKKPWETNDKRVLYEISDSIRVICILLWPFIPNACEDISRRFRFEVGKDSFAQIRKPLEEDSKIKKGKILFKKIELNDNELKQKINKPSNPDKRMANIKDVSKVSFSEWVKLDIRVGKIIAIEELEGADKLLKLTVNIGKEERVIVAGLKEFYSQEDLKNKQIVVLTNLEPKKMKGVESQGMLLAAVVRENGKEKPVLISPESEVPMGSQIA